LPVENATDGALEHKRLYVESGFQPQGLGDRFMRTFLPGLDSMEIQSFISGCILKIIPPNSSINGMDFKKSAATCSPWYANEISSLSTKG